MKTRITTVVKAEYYIEEVSKSRTITNVVVLPSEAGDRGGQESDLEDVLDDGEEDHEPAGKLEIEESDSEIEEEHNSPPRKRQFIAKSIWSKRGTFDNPFSP